MSKMYNLRSSRKRVTFKDCYLQKYKNISPEALNPKVCLERLKILDTPEHRNSTFRIQKDKILMPKGEIGGPTSNKKFFLKITLLTFVFISLVMLFYLQDERKNMTKNSLRHSVNFRKGFNDELQVHTKQKDKIKEINDTASKVKYIPHDNSEIKDFVRNHFQQLYKTNKRSEKSTLFIEEQCKREPKTDLASSLETNTINLYSKGENNPKDLTDYALEHKGAIILNTFGTEPYGVLTMKFLDYEFGTILNYFFQKYFNPKGPASILQPWRKPGDCWAFKGSHGRVQIQLSEKIIITAITIDHITKKLSPIGNLESAPKTFSIVGITNDGPNQERIYLGRYEYKLRGPAMQTFTVKQLAKMPCKIVEVNIESNHGNKEYTCVYKIRVHGYK